MVTLASTTEVGSYFRRPSDYCVRRVVDVKVRTSSKDEIRDLVQSLFRCRRSLQTGRISLSQLRSRIVSCTVTSAPVNFVIPIGVPAPGVLCHPNRHPGSCWTSSSQSSSRSLADFVISIVVQIVTTS